MRMQKIIKKTNIDSIKKSYISRTSNKERILIFVHKKSKKSPLVSLNSLLKHLNQFLAKRQDRRNINKALKKLIDKEYLKRYNCTYGRCDHSRKCKSCIYNLYFEKSGVERDENSMKTYLLLTKKGRYRARKLKREIKLSTQIFKLL